MSVELCLWQGEVSLKPHRVSALSRWRFAENIGAFLETFRSMTSLFLDEYYITS